MKSIWVNSEKNKNFLECLGMPAAGKSTIVKKMKAENDTVTVINDLFPQRPYKRNFFKLKCILIYLSSYPSQFTTDAKIIVQSRQTSFKDLLIVLSNWFLIIYLYEENSKQNKNIYILDQGIFQALWSISYSSRVDVDMNKLLENKILPKKVCYIDTSDEVLIERAIRRSTPLRLNYKEELHIKKGRAALHKVVSCLKENGYSKY